MQAAFRSDRLGTELLIPSWYLLLDFLHGNLSNMGMMRCRTNIDWVPRELCILVRRSGFYDWKRNTLSSL